ncbi:MAG: SH3 domain-containing protein [Myxococcales bacterium]|nr:SH3 domain-containing protein [Polyangiaceae bacterium]MDW8250557.1 SH3 domain-containing protein [Myxococcales bacterium]
MSILKHLPKALVMMTLVGASMALSACEGAGAVDSEQLVGVEEPSGEELTGTMAVGTQVKTTANLNLRSGPSTSHKVLRVMPKGSTVTIVSSSPNNSFYQVKHDGLTGWAHGSYLTLSGSNDSSGGGSSGGGSPSNPAGSESARDQAIQRAKSGVGFSYWWGHGRWRPEGPTASTKGSCSGSCPNCSHSGQYGADCSGYVAKIWQVPSTNTDLTKDSHPYSTADFVKDSSQWSTISRSSLAKGDAMVYNTNGSGHIILFSSGDGWGSLNAYECKGCSAGCVYNTRTASSSYKAIRRKGW